MSPDPTDECVAFEAFLREEAPRDYDISNADARRIWQAAFKAGRAALASSHRIFMDELDAGIAGEEWLRQHLPGSVSMARSEEPSGGRSPRLRWVVLFDCNDRLTHGYTLTRDIMNWTQLTLISTTPSAVDDSQGARQRYLVDQSAD